MSVPDRRFSMPHGNRMDANFCGDVEGLSPWWLINIAAVTCPLAGKGYRTMARTASVMIFAPATVSAPLRLGKRVRIAVRVEGEVFEGPSPAKDLRSDTWRN